MDRIAPTGVALLGLTLVVATCAVAPERPPLPDPDPIEVGLPPPPLPYAPGFQAVHYHVDLDLRQPGPGMDARATVVIAVEAPRPDTLRLDLTGLRVREVQVATAPGDADSPVAPEFYQTPGQIVLPLPATAGPGDTLCVTVTYGGQPTDGLILGENLHGDWVAFADNWPNRARFWFPSIDHPSQKATVSFAVRPPDGWRVLSNGSRLDAPAHDPTPPDDGVWRYQMPVPLPTYLMVVGVAPFTVGVLDECADGGIAPARRDRCVAVTSWTFPEDSARGMAAFRRTPEMVEFYSRLVAPYPYTKLAHAQSATRFGGMENAGAIFYAEDAIAEGRDIEGTVAHETAHQWFGNAVTPHDWPHLWLSEGFATYFGGLYFEHADGDDAFRARLDGVRRGYLQSRVHHLAMVDTLTIPGGNLLGLLNANSYNKGGAVLHMLRGLLGDDVFFAGIRRYYNAHLHGTAITADLRRALEAEAGRDLGWFFHQWVYRPGHPVLRFGWEWDQDRGEAIVRIEQVQDPAWPTFRLPVEIEFTTDGAAIRRTAEIRDRQATLRFPLANRPDRARLDPDGWLLYQAR